MAQTMPPSKYSVTEAAERIGVSERRIRALIYSGQLHAERIGSNYIIDPEELAVFGRLDRSSGRPLSAKNAWALLAQLSGYPDAVPVSLRSSYRLRNLVEQRSEDLVELLAHAQPRSESFSWQVLQSDLDQLADDDQLVRSGLAAEDRSLDVSFQLGRDPLDGYVDRKTLRALKRRLRPVEDPHSSNLLLRVPLESVWILEHENAPTPVVAADLLKHRDARVRRAARSALRAVVR
jgi:excisionase family DNA binding protein